MASTDVRAMLLSLLYIPDLKNISRFSFEGTFRNLFLISDLDRCLKGSSFWVYFTARSQVGTVVSSLLKSYCLLLELVQRRSRVFTTFAMEVLTSLILLFPVLTISTWLWFWRLPYVRQVERIPGPPALPLFGNIFALPKDGPGIHMSHT